MTPTIERGRSFDAWADEYDRYRPPTRALSR